MISVKTHNVLDYLAALLLMSAPWLFNFSYDNVATTTIMVLGIITLIYSLVTNYPFSLVKLIPFRVHLILDFFAGIFLIVAPWIFMFNENIRWSYIVLGIVEMVVVLLSIPPKEKNINRSKQNNTGYPKAAPRDPRMVNKSLSILC